MRRLAPVAALVLALALAACKDERSRPEAAPPQAPERQAQRPRAFTMRDLALATAVDARGARLTVAGADVEAAVAAAGSGERAGASALLPALEVARAELEQAVSAVGNPLDRALADGVAARAGRYVGELAAAVRSGAPGAALALSRRELGEAIAAYRESRATWRLDVPQPQGAEREVAEARRDMERAESAVVSRTRVAPRDEGHELDPAAMQMTARMAVERARAAALRLPPSLRDAGVRWAAAQEKVMGAVTALGQAGEAESARAARAYHAAKADALLALADYYAALASR